MNKRVSPGIDRAIEPQNGFTRDGQPLSYNRSPAADLAPWVARLYATVVDAPADHQLNCGLFNDTSMLRFQIRGDWQAHTADGLRSLSRSALLFGPHSQRMPVSVAGSFTSIGISLRPGAFHALTKRGVESLVDRLVFSEEIGVSSEAALAALDQGGDVEDWLGALEDLIRKLVADRQCQPPDRVVAMFEAASLADPSVTIADFARDCRVEQRSLERLIRRDFGMAPKQVLRRARALDMASHLRGVADSEEAEALMLRFYDQSHLIREFTALFGMSPRQFVSSPQPILTLALESRQARRLEALDRLVPGEARPWQ